MVDDGYSVRAALAEARELTERLVKENLAATLYGGKGRELTPAQAARAPGHYWTRYPGQSWTLDLWDCGCWTYHGHDETSTDDPPEIVGPLSPPPATAADLFPNGIGRFRWG